MGEEVNIVRAGLVAGGNQRLGGGQLGRTSMSSVELRGEGKADEREYHLQNDMAMHVCVFGV